jgi:hypothetical protein
MISAQYAPSGQKLAAFEGNYLSQNSCVVRTLSEYSVSTCLHPRYVRHVNRFAIGNVEQLRSSLNAENPRPVQSEIVDRPVITACNASTDDARR